MGKITGFLEFDRKVESYAPVEERVKNYHEFTLPLKEPELKEQGARCMDCGIPFCHSGCPLGNLIPDFNDAVYRGKWDKAAKILHSTNNFPEFTGRLCPAPCEEACVLGINEDPVTIENIEKNIVETAFKKGWVVAEPPATRTGKKVAVVGSGPAGLAAAQQLNRAGHLVTVFERDEKPGGLLRYGIPDFKMEKNVIDRRLKVLEEEGIVFKCGVHVGKDITGPELQDEFDAIVLSGGATVRRNLPIEGADLKGVVQAMDFLPQNNRRVDGVKEFENEIMATGKDVVVIGGGDTGSDCIGTSIRHGAKSVSNFEIMPMGTVERPESQPWPFWPMRLKTSTSHKEGAERFFSISTKKFLGDENGNLKGLITSEVEWIREPGKSMVLKEVEGTEKEWKCELALLALGFTGSEMTVAEQLGVEADARTNIKASEQDYMTNVPGVFAAGDQRRGQSLIVWAISEGRQAAHHVDTYLMGESALPLKGEGDLPRV
ncbi:glutamate synthase subunit beta [Zobellia galactanivorans]|uniref:Glutamate synthase [NADPH] small chain n=1 Tax=Zobellia galactanivorans (strain DSM 12802 / CCUG 47099 / CIP 106680 / NCIMB 13871 / Dsij) TaxID=63186 RepID=G0LA08_ZOBGA|nr:MULTISPECIES: glutamate synthase subunit beta [Zobellia]MBU3025255.1 glutamate synthase subunit beta [Zobellia galactanivorans]MDO6811114.1 glutamate synthase subunit beta [Zobellia galactanivorans]OWW24255.1 glutamate synthase [Zobellia sp. OII3]CAZ94973.1 Glutamate synthase [NADPH] small chain [Zobellia galactanivorans]